MFPSLLISRLENILGKSKDEIIDIFSLERKGSFRINTLKNKKDFILSEMKDRGIGIKNFESIPDVYTFENDNLYSLRGSESFYQGYIYLQSISSILPIFAFEKESKKILDICASPGGKTTGLSAYLGEKVQITALEKNQIRYDRMLHNIRLQGAKNIQTHKIDALRFLEEKNETYDAILLDAPCSGEGTFSLHREKSYRHWSLDFIEKKSLLQKSLLQKASKSLKAGGYIIYSTCTLAPEENEAVITDFLEKNNDFSLETIEVLEGILGENTSHGLSDFEEKIFDKEIRKTIRIVPSQYFEGFFIAKLRKN